MSIADSTDILSRIQAARRRVDDAAANRIRLQAMEDSFKHELETYKETLKEQGIDPSNLDHLIEEARAKLEGELETLEGAITVQAS